MARRSPPGETRHLDFALRLEDGAPLRKVLAMAAAEPAAIHPESAMRAESSLSAYPAFDLPADIADARIALVRSVIRDAARMGQAASAYHRPRLLWLPAADRELLYNAESPGALKLTLMRLTSGPEDLRIRVSLHGGNELIKQRTNTVERSALARIHRSVVHGREVLDRTGVAAWRSVVELEGRSLANMFIGECVLRELASVAGQVGTPLEVTCTDRDIPVELMTLRLEGRERLVGEHFAVSRSFFELPMYRRIRKGPAVLLADELERFDVSRECTALEGLARELLICRGFVRALSILKGPSVESERRVGWGYVHFAVHGRAPREGPELAFSDGTLIPEYVKEAAGDSEAVRSALVFLNACVAGSSREGFDAEDCFFYAFAFARAAAVVAPVWAVGSDAASQVAAEVYTDLRAGLPLAEAVRRARCASDNQPERLSYVVYCTPDCRLDD
jgi:hypothetical protein